MSENTVEVIDLRTVLRLLGGNKLTKVTAKRRNKRRENTRPRMKYLSVYSRCNRSFGIELLPKNSPKTPLPSDSILNSESKPPCNTKPLVPSATSVTSFYQQQLSKNDQNVLEYLQTSEMTYHPNNAFLFYVNSQVEDKVNAALRNEAVFNLRFLHCGYFNLSPETFFKAVNLLDRFIVRVKVKPKYISCVTAACYYIASQRCETDQDRPTAENLVQITHCGGTAVDLRRMEDIINAKLNQDLSGITALDFVKALTTDKRCIARVTARLQIAMCSLEVYRYRPACLSFASLLLDSNLSDGQSSVIPKKVMMAAKFCRVEWSEVKECCELIRELCDGFYRQTLPCSRRRLIWCLSRRTRAQMVFSSIPSLTTVSEQ